MDRIYLVVSGRDIATVTLDLSAAIDVALVEAAKMTSRGGALGHVMINVWQGGVMVTDYHVYDGTPVDLTENI